MFSFDSGENGWAWASPDALEMVFEARTGRKRGALNTVCRRHNYMPASIYWSPNDP